MVYSAEPPFSHFLVQPEQAVLVHEDGKTILVTMDEKASALCATVG